MSHATITWFGGKQFVGVDSTKHSVVVSAQDEATATGIKPPDLLLIDLVVCCALDGVVILRKKRLDLREFDIKIKGVAR
jgi:putative redox protein